MVKRMCLAILIIMLLFGHVISQVNDTCIIGIDIAEVMPYFDGGKLQLENFIDSLLLYPEKAIMDSIEGNVYLSCIVDTTGKTMNHKILKGIRNDLDEEALRVAALITFDSPAYQRGKPIKIRYNFVIKFVLPKKE
jgi:protein TonB